LKNEGIAINLSANRSLIIAFAISCLALSFSFGAEYLASIKACNLCKLQRIPFFVILTISAIGIFLNIKKQTLVCISIFALISMLFGTYHFFVQQGFVKDPCKVQKVENLADFHRILEAKTPCAEKLSIFKVPIPVFNIIGSFLCLIFSVKKVISHEISFRRRFLIYGLHKKDHPKYHSK